MTKKIIWGIVIVVAILLIAGFLANINTPEGKTIKIGAIFPLTGKEASVGESQKNGMDLAVTEINKTGGINGQPIKVIYEDSVSETAKAVSAYQKLTRIDGATAIFTSLSGVTLGIAPIAEKDKVLNLNIGGAAATISSMGDYTFRHSALPQDESKALATFVYNNMKINEVAMLVVKTESGISASNEFRKFYEALGGKISISESYEKGATDYKTLLLKIKALKTKNIATISYAAEMGIQFKQAKELDMDVQWFTAFTAEDPQTIVSGGEAANGVIYTHYYDAHSTDLNFTQYKNSYRTAYKADPGPYSALSYDFINILASAMRQCQNPYDSTCVKNELYKIQNYSGVTGKISFDSNGDTNKGLIIKTIKNGEFVKY